MVFQRFNLFPHMTVLENLIMAPMSRVMNCETIHNHFAAVRFFQRVQAAQKRTFTGAGRAEPL